MPRYSYRARNAEGKLVEGQVEAGDRAAAIQLIEQKRCIPIKIEADGDAKPARGACERCARNLPMRPPQA